ncbi:MAG: IS110 family transposase [Gemmatimonadetes bacterium]|nr:IS110 family transposase [Gemmatimonadota bacterium]
MVDALQGVPETPYLLSIPKVAPVTAAVFLGSIGDPRAYESSGQILRVAGLSLIERSSGILRGTKRISSGAGRCSAKRRTCSRSGVSPRTACSGPSTRRCASAMAARR